MSVDGVERRLGELRARTDGVRARPGFQARVMLAVAREAANAFRAELARASRRFVPVALAVSVCALVWASRGDGVTSSDLAQAELRWELSW
jgi:hypothetical protein